MICKYIKKIFNIQKTPKKTLKKGDFNGLQL